MNGVGAGGDDGEKSSSNKTDLRVFSRHRRRRTKNTTRPMMTRRAIPPTTPPAMAPAGLEEDLSGVEPEPELEPELEPESEVFDEGGSWSFSNIPLIRTLRAVVWLSLEKTELGGPTHEALYTLVPFDVARSRMALYWRDCGMRKNIICKMDIR